MLIQITKYLHLVEPIHLIGFGIFSFVLISFFVPIYKHLSKQSRIIRKSYLLSDLGFINLNKGYKTKFPIIDSYFIIAVTMIAIGYLWFGLPILYVFIAYTLVIILFLSIYSRIIFYQEYFVIKYIYKKDVFFYYKDIHKIRVEQGYKKSIILNIIFNDSMLKAKKVSFHPAYWYRDRELISIILATKVNGRTETEVLANLNENDF